MIYAFLDRPESVKSRPRSPLIAAALIASLAPAAIAQDCDRPVYPQPMFQVGDFPTQVELADINGDGIGDILTLNTQSRTISVLLGEGSGAYETQFGFFAGQDAIDMQLADFDSDGDLDLVVLSRQNVQVSYFANPGDGRFANRVTYPLLEDFFQTDLYTMTIDDLDADGDPDLIVPRPDESMASVLWNSGSGMFTLETDYEPVQWEQPTFIARADVDLDGDLDFVTASDSIQVCTYLNNGDGTYADRDCTSSNGADVAELIFGDLNADGLADIVSLPEPGSNNERIAIFMNNGAGGFMLGEEFQFFEIPIGAALGDLDQDGDPDLIVGVNNAFGSDGYISILSNNGDGMFEEEGPLFDENIDVGDVKLIDADDDGLLDLLYTRSRTDRAALIMGRGDGGLVIAEQIGSDLVNEEFELVDLDLDGDADLIGADRFTGDLLVSLSLRNGTFEDAMRFSVGESAYIRGTGDFDNDGDIDVILATPESSPQVEGAHAVVLNNGDGTFAAPLPRELVSRTSELEITDYDGDGTLDLIELTQETLLLYAGIGDGTFADAQQLHDVVSLERVEAFNAGDLDQNGSTDFVLFGQQDFTLWFVITLLNNGDGTFSEGAPNPMGLGPSGTELRDLDMDGDLDVITVNPSSDDANVFINEGQGQLASRVRYTTGDEHVYYQLIDYDQDGDLDLVTAGEDPYSFTILINDGNAGFGQKELYSGPGDVNGGLFRMGDIDASGYPDIVASSNGLLVYLDQCTERDACPADLNGDGDLNFFDVSAFLKAYGASEPVADFNGDGQFNFFDVTAFIVAFNAGCP